MKPVIVIIAYNREKPLERLLGSLGASDYPADDIPLVISIDRSDNGRVLKTAEAFEWKHGKKEILERDVRLGLKKHVLDCSSLAERYGSAIILEDDLYLAADFYGFACAMLEASQTDEKIAGVSLYNHRLNVHAREPFEAVNDGSDVWYFQFASSWGQAYTADQWKAFREWLSEYDLTDFPDSVPDNVRGWGESSWLKYFIRYCVEKDRYFIYPALSRTTNFSDAGTHRMGQASELSVPLRVKGGESEEMGYRLTPLKDSPAVYDAWFENVRLKELFEYETVIDLYGKKPVPDTGWFLSSQVLPFERIKSYGRLLRPLEANIFSDIPGEDFFLYDVERKAAPPAVNKADRLFYNYRAFRPKYGFSMAVQMLRDRLRHS